MLSSPLFLFLQNDVSVHCQFSARFTTLIHNREHFVCAFEHDFGNQKLLNTFTTKHWSYYFGLNSAGVWGFALFYRESIIELSLGHEQADLGAIFKIYAPERCDLESKATFMPQFRKFYRR